MGLRFSRLGDIADVVDSLHKTPSYVADGHPMVRVVDVKYGPLNLKDTRKVDETVFTEFSRRYKPEIDDTVITRVGSYGISALVKDTHFCLGQNTAAISPKINKRYFYLALNSPEVRQQIEHSTVGSTQKTLSLKAINNLEIPRLGNLAEQSIARFLGALDDKIELNRRMNETLEEMAQALFRDWFVDFGPTRRQMDGATDPAAIIGHAFPPEKATTLAPLFPAKLGDDGLPEGWSKGEVSDLADLNPKSWSAKNHPQTVEYVDLSNTKWGRIEEVTPYEWSEAPSRARRTLEVGDSIVGTVRPGNGSYSLIGKSGLTGSTGFAVLRPKHSTATEFVYCALTAPENIEKLANLADGGAYPAINPKVVAATGIARTGTDVIEAFSDVSQSMFAKRHANDQENQTLAEMRDLLLPKLMSGEIRLKDAEEVAE